MNRSHISSAPLYYYGSVWGVSVYPKLSFISRSWHDWRSFYRDSTDVTCDEFWRQYLRLSDCKTSKNSQQHKTFSQHNSSPIFDVFNQTISDGLFPKLPLAKALNTYRGKVEKVTFSIRAGALASRKSDLAFQVLLTE